MTDLTTKILETDRALQTLAVSMGVRARTGRVPYQQLKEAKENILGLYEALSSFKKGDVK